MKKYNTLVTKDDVSGAVYFYAPNYHPQNNPPKVKHSIQVDSEDLGIICIDINENREIVGIEIVNGDLIKL